MGATKQMQLELDNVRYKVDDEGLGYCIQHYYGRDINTVDKDLNAAWAEAYDALGVVENILGLDDDYDNFEEEKGNQAKSRRPC